MKDEQQGEEKEKLKRYHNLSGLTLLAATTLRSNSGGRVVLGGLGLAGYSKVGEVELAALGVGPDEVRLLRVQEGQRLAARSVRVDAHFLLLLNDDGVTVTQHQDVV